MAVEVDDLCRVVINGSIHGQRTINVLHFKALQNGNTLLQLLLTAVIECIARMITQLSQEWNFEGVKGTMITGDFDEITDTTGSESGDILTDALPSLCAGVIRFHTATRGRSGRGRMYIAGVPEASHGDSKFENPNVSLGPFLNCLLEKFVGLSGNPQTVPEWKFGILSRKDLKANPNNPLAAFRPVVGGSINHDVCTMRSRKLRGPLG